MSFASFHALAYFPSPPILRYRLIFVSYVHHFHDSEREREREGESTTFDSKSKLIREKRNENHPNHNPEYRSPKGARSFDPRIGININTVERILDLSLPVYLFADPKGRAMKPRFRFDPILDTIQYRTAITRPRQIAIHAHTQSARWILRIPADAFSKDVMHARVTI